MKYILKFWWAIVALVGGFSLWASRKPKERRNETLKTGYESAAARARAERKMRQQAEADAELERKRNLSDADRLHDVLERARRRRGGS